MIKDSQGDKENQERLGLQVYKVCQDQLGWGSLGKTDCLVDQVHKVPKVSQGSGVLLDSLAVLVMENLVRLGLKEKRAMVGYLVSQGRKESQECWAQLGDKA